MKFTNSMLEARSSILKQGIQQTNRYKFRYPNLYYQYKEVDDIFQYPYSIVLPGFGFDLIDHSIWSVIRKIPFRKTYSELQVTFILGTSNYKKFIGVWDSLITTPNITNNGAVSNVWAYSSENGISPDSFDISGGLLTSEKYNGEATIPGKGGATNYMDLIHDDNVYIQLLDETGNSTTILTFHESFVSQIAPVQLTSTETGYSTFQVNFKFAKVTVS
jgi:hypothetical protein